MRQPGSILLVEDDKNSRLTLTVCLEEEGYRVRPCATAEEAIGQVVSGAGTDIVISDLKLPDGSGLQILWALKKINPDVAFILITGHATEATAIEAVNEGAFAYHVKPLETDALIHSVRSALHQRRLLSENRELLQRLERTNEELRISSIAEAEEKNRELERVSSAKTQILSTVTHELKTPLTIILGHVERMLGKQDRVGRLNEIQKTHLEKVHRNALQLRDLIDDILDVSTIESSSLTLNREQLDLREVIEAVAQSMQDLVSESGIRLALDLPSDLPAVTADRRRLSQVVSNLLSNACKYSPSGATTEIAARQVGGFLQIDVADSGVGMSQKDQSKLFTKFFRVDNSLTTEISGTGLGLFIVRHIVEAHGGRIWVASEEGKGSTISFNIPASDASVELEDLSGGESSRALG